LQKKIECIKEEKALNDKACITINIEFVAPSHGNHFLYFHHIEFVDSSPCSHKFEWNLDLILGKVTIENYIKSLNLFIKN